jgi:hypothetical protein
VQSCFTPRMHRNAQRDPQIQPVAKKQVGRNVCQQSFSRIHTGST